MAILKAFSCFAETLFSLKANATTKSLDEIAIAYDNYSYIGARKTLQAEVLKRAQSVPHKEQKTPEECAELWFRRKKWDTNSGVFPDFVLGYEAGGGVGDGALLELKDSESGTIASFNSTIPAARKVFSHLSPLVKDSVSRWESATKRADECDCFYMIRTHCKDPDKVRISLVQGTFFETLSTPELLKALWGNLLPSDITSAEKQTVLDVLSRLDRDDISMTQHIPKASIKPRLRLMSEIDAEGNPHTYSEIPARTLNLITQIDPQSNVPDDTVLQMWATCEGLTIKQKSKDSYLVTNNKFEYEMKVFTLQHKRNGLHRVCQVTI